MANISAKQLTEALKLRKAIDQLEARIETTQAKLSALLGGGTAKKKPGRPAKTQKKSRRKKAAAKRGPRSGSQKELVHDILRDAGTPLSTDQVLEQLKAKGYRSKSKEPKKSLGVMLYTDKAIKRAGRGLFTLGGSTAPKAKKKRATKK